MTITTEETSTHNNVMTHAGNIVLCFLTLNFDLLTQNKWIFRTRGGTFVSSLVILTASVFEISCGKTDRYTSHTHTHTNTHTNAAETLTHATANGVSNYTAV